MYSLNVKDLLGIWKALLTVTGKVKLVNYSLLHVWGLEVFSLGRKGIFSIVRIW